MRDIGDRPLFKAGSLSSLSLRAFGLAVVTAVSSCQAINYFPAPKAKATIAGSVHDVLAALPATADSHTKTAAVVFWMADHIQLQRHQPAADASDIIGSGSADPMSSAYLLTAMLKELQVESRTHIITGVPGFGWYPLVEVLDADGDHLWDPFAGRYAPDYDGTPLGFSQSITATALLGPTGMPFAPDSRNLRIPDFTELSTHKSFVWNDSEATSVVARIDFSLYSSLEIGNRLTGIGSAGEYWPGFAVAGVTSNELGPIAFMQTYELTGLVPGMIYELRLTLNQGQPANLLIMAEKAQLQTRKTSGADTALRFSATGTQATVNIATLGRSFLRFDNIRWSRE